MTEKEILELIQRQNQMTEGKINNALWKLTEDINNELKDYEDKLQNLRLYIEAIKGSMTNSIDEKVKSYLDVKKWLIDLDSKNDEEENKEQDV